MIVRQVLQWMQTATPEARADVARDLAQSYLLGELSHDDRVAAENSFIIFLDDESPLVRLALAESFARAANAPFSVVAGLAHDLPEIASLVLTHSPLFIENELAEMAKTLRTPQQLAMLAREDVSPKLALNLAKYGDNSVVEQLLDLQELDQHSEIIEVILERFGHDAALRNKMNTLYSLSATNKFTLIQLQNADFNAMMLKNGWLTEERAKTFLKDATDKAALSMAINLEEGLLQTYILALSSKGVITTSLLLRAMFSGHLRFVERALAHLSDLDLKRVIGLSRDTQGKGLKALLTAANIPSEVHGVFEHCFEARKGDLSSFIKNESLEMFRGVISETIDRVRLSAPVNVLMLLRRFEAEAAKEEARLFKAAMLQPEIAEEEIQDETLGWDYNTEINKTDEELVMDLTEQVSAIELFKREIEAKKNAPARPVIEVKPIESIAPVQQHRLPQTKAKPFAPKPISRLEFDEMVRKLEGEVKPHIYRKAA